MLRGGEAMGAATSQERLGLLFAMLCALNGAFVPAVAKLTTGRATPLFVAAATSAVSALAAVLLLAWRGEFAWLTRPRIGWRLLLIAALATTAANLLFFAGASRSSAIVATLCLQVEPAYALLLAWLALGHRPTRRRLLATAALLAGIGLALGATEFETSGGVWLLLATPLCWQLSHLIVLRGLVGVPALVVTSARYLHGGALLVLAWLALEGPAALPPLVELRALAPWLVLQGAVLGYAGTLAWYLAIARLDLARATAIVVPTIPLLAIGASFALLGEIPTARQWLGLGLTAIGIAVFVTGKGVTGER